MMSNENEFLKYMEIKAAEAPSDSYEKEMNEVLMSLYNKGLIDVVMEDGEPMISISDKGHESFLADYAMNSMPAADA